jgi:hypothetical protein
MQIVCPACTKRLQLADDKLPTDRQVRLTCPACQERFVFDPSTAKTLTDSPARPSTGSAALASAGSRSPSTSSGTNLDLPDVGPAPRALVCLNNAEHRDACLEMLLALGYSTVHFPTQQAQAITYLSQVPYECCILDAIFDGSTLEANPILACVLELPMERRRYMFAALCIPDGVTGDPIAAYSSSVNLVINSAELPTGRRTLEQHMAEHKRLYRVYRELRQQLGKDI